MKRFNKTAILSVILLLNLYPTILSQNVSTDEVQYTLSPVINDMMWDNELGLKDAFFYGGKLGIDFGSLIGLETYYLTSGNIRTGFSGIDLRDTSGAFVNDNQVKIQRIGGNLIIRWPSGSVAPFVKLGGGVIKFKSETGSNVEKIAVGLGGGFDYVINSRLRTRAWVEMNRFRLDRYTLAQGGTESGLYPIDPDAEKIRNNLSVGLSFDFAIGQSRFTKDISKQRIQPFSALELEPIVGRLDFDDSEMATATVAGGRIGGELNPWVGWGVFYWHAMKSDFSDTKPFQSYGGEVRFNLASKEGPQPYVTIGAGQLDFRSGFKDSDGMERDDKTALIMGAGIRAEIFNGLLLNVSARDYMYGKERLDNLSGTNEISHNWMFSGALVFGIGSKGTGPKFHPDHSIPKHSSGSEPEKVKPVTIKIETDTTIVKDTVRIISLQKPQTETNSSVKNYVSDKSISIPIPLEGEIYIRYGETSRDIGKGILSNAVPTKDSVMVSKESKSDSIRVNLADTSTAITKIQPTDSLSIDSLKLTGTQDTNVSKSELDSLINSLKTELNVILAAQLDNLKLQQADTSRSQQTSEAATLAENSISELRKELIASEIERKKLDSLLRVISAQSLMNNDSASEQKMQAEISKQIASALADRPSEAGSGLDQEKFQKMMEVLTKRMDSVISQQGISDPKLLQEQLQFEARKQTKNQEELQQVMEEFIKRYGNNLDKNNAVPPTIIVTQPQPTTEIIDNNKPSTIVVQPDTQYVVITDSSGQVRQSLPLTSYDIIDTSEENDFIDLRPSANIGFGLERPKQFIVGCKFDLGPITTKTDKLRLIPEFALGLGGSGVSIMAVMNAEYSITNIEVNDYRLIPYTRIGFGILGFGGDIPDRSTEGVFNFTYGLSVDTRETGLLRGIGDPAIFIEHQIIDIFDLNRILVGFQWSR